MAEINFDASTVKPDAGFDTVPAGWYNVAMDESEMKPTKDGSGAYLKCRFDILDGQYKGRKVYTNLNIKNANAQTVEIAYGQLSAIAHAVGILQVKNTELLHGRPLKIKVSIRKGNAEYPDDQNDIKSYKNINEVVDGPAPAAAAPGTGSTFTPPPTATAPVIPPAPALPPAAPAAPAAPVDPLVAAKADGWIVHPTAAGYLYKGQEVLTDDQVRAKYPAAPAAPATPAAPAAPAVPAAPAAPAEGAWAPPGGAAQPWQAPAADPAAAAQQEAPPWAAPAA